MLKLKHWIAAGSLVLISGCATQAKLSDTEISNRYPELGQLESQLKIADDKDVELFSAALYNKANNEYDNSLNLARKGDDKARQRIKTGQTLLKQATSSSVTAKDELAGVINARDRAIKVGANTKNARSFTEADHALIELGNLVAEGEIADVRDQRAELAKQYARLEIEALKNATASDAEQMIATANKAKADRYAPNTLKQAVTELALAKDVLDSDVNAREKAAGHAQQAYAQASRAIQITEIIKEFKQSNMTDEQQVLWFQTQLANAVAPLNSSLDFGKANKILVNEIAADIRTVLEQAKQHKQSLEKSRQEYASQVLATEAERKINAEFEARFKTIQNTFNSDEAEVFRQGNNILIRSYGFNFPSGGSEIQSENFPLLKKMIAANYIFFGLSQYPS